MSDSGCPPFGRLDPDELARTERFIDALATCQPVEFDDVGDCGDPGDRELAGLLEDWRNELRSPPADVLCSELEVIALNRGLASRRRLRRGLALIGSVAATVLGVGGFSAMVGDAQPGDALYGVHTMLFGELPSVHDDRIALSAKTDLSLVQQMITQGDWDQAQNKLSAVSDSVQRVNDNDRKRDLIDQVNLFHAKVANRDPNATVAPSSSSNPEFASVTGATTPVIGTTAEATGSATSTDASATALPPSPSTIESTGNLSATSSPVGSAAPASGGVTSSSGVTSSPVSSAPPAAGVSSTPTTAPSGDRGATTRQSNPGAG
ncbi:MAG: hypothetical protein J2P17_17295 [Mycobacterium sp.]|nr:hypothetical protein [Mycobacterium sp.]